MTSSNYRGRLLLALGCSALTACTLLLSADVEDQCSTNADCTSRGPAFAGTVCTPQHVCTTAATTTADSGADATDVAECKTNKECIDRNGGSPYACRKSDKRCVSLLSPTCDRIYGQKADLESEEVVHIGFMSAGRTGNTAPVGLQEEAAADLAVREIARGAAGLPPRAPGLPRRPYVLISCDEIASSADSVRYLVDQIQVPAIIGPALSNNFIAATATTIAKDVLIVSTTASSPLIATLDKKGLVYSVNPSDALAASAWVKYLPTIETALRNKADLDPGQPLKVLVLQRGDGLGIGLVDVLLSTLTFNGKNAATNSSDGNLKIINYGDPFDTVNNPNPQAKYAAAATEFANYKPHVVIGAGTTELAENILTPVEKTLWSEPNYRPFYIGVRALETPAMINLMKESEDDAGSAKSFRNRVVTTGFGVDPTSPVFVNFKARYSAEFSGQAEVPPPAQYAAQGYDATYLLAYAIAAAGAEPLTGARLSAGLLKTQPTVAPAPAATKVDIGPVTLSNAFIDLANGKTLDFGGASGPLDFNQATGTSSTDVFLRCPAVDGNNKATGFKDSGKFLSVTTGELSGPFNCAPL